MKKKILITGEQGVGKTTLARLINATREYSIIDGVSSQKHYEELMKGDGNLIIVTNIILDTSVFNPTLHFNLS